MLGLASIEVYKSVFIIAEENIKCKLYVFPDSKKERNACEKVRDEIENVLEISVSTATNLLDETIGPKIIEENRKEVSKTMKKDRFMDVLPGFTDYIFQDFGS